MPVYEYKRKTRNPSNNTYIWFRYEGRYTDAFGKRKDYFKRGFQSKRVAQAEERKFLVLLKNKPTTNILFEDIIVEFLEYKSTKVKARSLYDFERTIGKHITPYFGKIIARKITIPMIEQWQKELLEKDYSNDHLKSIQGLLKSIFKFAMRKMYLDQNPFEYVEYVSNPNKKKRPIQFFTHEQYKNFISVATDDEYKLLFETLYFTGMRISELQARKWSDLDFNNGTLVINTNYDTRNRVITQSTKNGTDRIIYLNKNLLDGLKKRREEVSKFYEYNDDWYIFGSIKVIPQKTVENRKELYIKQWNEIHPNNPLPKIRVHDFRHSHVSLLINNASKEDLDSYIIAERLGHSKEMVEKVYGHLFPERRKKILNILENL